MPVFHRHQDGVLVLTVDGDYTVEEFARNLARAGEQEPGAPPLRLLLDVSGTASRTEALMAEVVSWIEGGEGDARVAVLGGTPASATGVPLQTFLKRSEAMAWLDGG